MARTFVPTQRLATNSGQTITFVPIDAPNGMEALADGRAVVLVKSTLLATGTVRFPSYPCSHGRTEELEAPIAIDDLVSFGPFLPNLWGNGSGRVYIDFADTASDTVQIAVVETA